MTNIQIVGKYVAVKQLEAPQDSGPAVKGLASSAIFTKNVIGTQVVFDSADGSYRAGDIVYFPADTIKSQANLQKLSLKDQEFVRISSELIVAVERFTPFMTPNGTFQIQNPAVNVHGS